jgi:hypothetical protein
MRNEDINDVTSETSGEKCTDNIRLQVHSADCITDCAESDDRQ